MNSVPTTVSEGIVGDIEGDGILIRERKYDVAIGRRLCERHRLNVGNLFRFRSWPTLFTDLGVEITCQRVGNGGITVSLADSE
jgi:hypothetical protein